MPITAIIACPEKMLPVKVDTSGSQTSGTPSETKKVHTKNKGWHNSISGLLFILPEENNINSE